MLIDNFAVFILCHENPHNCKTYEALKKYGYTKDNWFIVLDDEDRCIEEYKEVFGKDKVLLFSKDDIEKTFDTMDNDVKRRGSVVWARNACFSLAKKLGYKYFIELDDDYAEFQFRFPDGEKLRLVYPVNLDAAFECTLKYFDANKIFSSIAFAQGGDFIGGLHGSNYEKGFLRKCMNTFICDVDRPFIFNGRINEDVNTYCLEGSRGKLFGTIVDLMVNQADTQTTSGGMADIYAGVGTYRKSFYSVICCPSFVTIRMMGDNWYRIHHSVKWENAVPKIISSRYKKEENR